MSENKIMNGGCMCGQVRYSTEGEPLAVIYCHCHSCRKHNGAPVVVLAGFRLEQVQFSGVERKKYESTSGVHRAFCGSCGTPLTWEGDGGDIGALVEIHISTFDEPENLEPTSHAFEPERIPWFDVADSLPRYEGFSGHSALLHHGPAPESSTDPGN